MLVEFSKARDFSLEFVGYLAGKQVEGLVRCSLDYPLFKPLCQPLAISKALAHIFCDGLCRGIDILDTPPRHPGKG